MKNRKLFAFSGLDSETHLNQHKWKTYVSHPHFHSDRYKYVYALKPTHTHTLWHTYKDMLDPPACLCPHAIVFIRGYWLAGQIFQPLAGELSNEGDHFQQALGPPPPKWRPHFCSSLNCLSVSVPSKGKRSLLGRDLISVHFKAVWAPVLTSCLWLTSLHVWRTTSNCGFQVATQEHSSETLETQLRAGHPESNHLLPLCQFS